MDLRDTKRAKSVVSPEDVFETGIREAQRADVFRKRTQQAVKWYLGLIRRIAPAKISRANFGKRNRLRQSVKPGDMYCYVYDAKTKADLPYWDRFPLVFPIAPTENGKGWYGLNLHYVPIQYRARILSQLYRFMTNKKYDQTTRLKLSYELLMGLGAMDKALAKVAFKTYLTERVKSRFVYIAPDEWPIAMFLPMEQWQKKSFGDVYFDIEKQIKTLRNK